MTKYCYDKWRKNSGKLEEALKNDDSLLECGYRHLLELVIRYVLNDDEFGEYRWSEEFVVLGDGDYQGALVFVIPRSDYCSSEYDYLMTYIEYGSCSGCDTLLNIQGCVETPKDAVNDIMYLCKDLVANIVRPYNRGWGRSELFDHVEVDG